MKRGKTEVLQSYSEGDEQYEHNNKTTPKNDKYKGKSEK